MLYCIQYACRPDVLYTVCMFLSSADAVSLGKICGHTTQILEYVTTYDTLKLVLTSDYLVSGRGFIGNYTILPNTGRNSRSHSNTVFQLTVRFKSYLLTKRVCLFNCHDNKDMYSSVLDAYNIYYIIYIWSS